jgi:hypothetical protein
VVVTREAKIDPELDSTLVALYRGWDLIEKRQHQSEIIDFDLAAPGGLASLQDRQDVLGQLEQLLASLPVLEPATEVLVRARLGASCAFLRALLGQESDFKSYIQETLGVEPMVFGEEEIQKRREAVEELLAERGIKFRRSKVGRFKELYLIIDTQKLPRQFEFFRTKWVPELLRQIPAPLDR